MSNQNVGSIYLSVIDEVINSSRVDFEEGGVDETVLEELRKGWQQKLSQLGVARFPWDPKPESAPAPPTSSDQNNVQPQFPADLSLPAHDSGAAVKQEDIKQEPMPIPPFSGLNGADDKVNLAASRAAQQLQLQYGVRAAGSINAIQDRMDQQQQQQQQNDESDDQAEAQPSVTQQGTTAPAAPQPGNQVHPDNGQTDGAADELDVSGHGELSRAVIDGMLHQRMITSARAMEGGGLMLTLEEDAASRPSRRAAKAALSRAKGKDKAIATFDGVDDDDDIDDEDAINSDLDDSQDENDDDEPDDEGLGHIMLCMYDKVQRVKNKWKCTLKDGVLTVNGKEYVFHKATGEYEW